MSILVIENKRMRMTDTERFQATNELMWAAMRLCAATVCA